MKQRQLFDKNPQMFFTKSSQPPLPKQLKIKTAEVTFSSQLKPVNDLYKSMRPIIWLGRLTLAIPCSRSNSTCYKRPSFSLKMIPYMASIIFIFYTIAQLICDIHFIIEAGDGGMPGVMNYVTNIRYTMNSMTGVIIYTHFLRHSDKFYRIFDKWTEFSFKTDFAHDPWLTPFGYFLTIIIVAGTSFAIGLSFSDVFSTMAKLPAANQTPVLEIVYKTKNDVLNYVIPYHPILAIFAIICYLILQISCSYTAVLVLFFSRTLSYQFKKVIEDATGLDAEDAHFANLEMKDKAFWQNIVSKYRSLCLLVKTINNFLSPLIFIWIIWNTYILAMLLYHALVGNDPLKISKYTFTITFMIHTIRFVISLINATKVNTYAMKILKVLSNCPKEHYHNAEVYRLEQEVSIGQNIGFTGMGCFTITKPFLLTIFNALFTMEIFLLQSSPNKN